MEPEHVAAFVAEFNAEWNRLQGEASAHEGAKRRELDAVGRKLDGLIDAIASGIRSTGLHQKLDELEARKAELERALQAQPRPRPLLHPIIGRGLRACRPLLLDLTARPPSRPCGR
jgi:site-specific DNA recombinase